MKFDFVMGNPPYQEITAVKESETNGQASRRNIFQHFQTEAEKIAGHGIVLIYPGGRWLHRSGKGMAEFGLQQINDVHLRQVIMYPDAGELFSNVAIADGISIVLKDMDKTEGGFSYVYTKGGSSVTVELDNPGDVLLPLDPQDQAVVRKIADGVSANGLAYLHDSILPRSLFGLESSFVQDNPGTLHQLAEGETVDGVNTIKILINDRAGKAGRATWFAGPRDVVRTGQEYIDQWQVVVSSANAGGQKRDSQMEVIDSRSAFGRARVALGSFKTEQEARNFFAYAKTYLIRFAFLMTDEALSSLGKWVPDLRDYTGSSGLVDFAGDLDTQLFDLFKLTDEERTYVRKRVDSVRGGSQ